MAKSQVTFHNQNVIIFFYLWHPCLPPEQLASLGLTFDQFNYTEQEGTGTCEVLGMGSNGDD